MLRLSLQEDNLQRRLDELKAVEVWARIVGEHIASQCARPMVKEAVMTVSVANASLRQELNMNRSRLAEAVNRYLNKNVITMIRFN